MKTPINTAIENLYNAMDTIQKTIIKEFEKNDELDEIYKKFQELQKLVSEKKCEIYKNKLIS